MDQVKGLLASKTVWSAIVAIIAGAASLFHYNVSAADQAQAVELFAGLGSAIGGIGAIIGRILATKKIAVGNRGTAAALVAGLLLPAVTLAACGSTPRQQDRALMSGYAAVLVATNDAIHSPLLVEKPKVVAEIQAVSHAATAAVDAFDDEARKCTADPVTGEVGSTHGQICDENLVATLLATANAAVGQAGSVLTAFGFPPR